MASHFDEMSEGLQKFWIDQNKRGNVRNTPRSGNCMLCTNQLTDKDEDHSVCNTCWEEMGEDE